MLAILGLIFLVVSEICSIFRTFTLLTSPGALTASKSLAIVGGLGFMAVILRHLTTGPVGSRD